MKRLSGGAVLLNLSAISLGITAGEVSITDAGILGELTELRNFIDVNRDFSKGFKNLKPVLIEYRSSASKFNGIALGNLSFNTDALHMSIGINTIQSDGKMLIVAINVVYEWVDYVGYQVKTAKLNAYETLATGDGTFTGDVGVGGDLEVTGDISGNKITGNEIVENMTGYSASIGTKANLTIENVYTSVVKNGNKITFVTALNLTRTGEVGSGALVNFTIPSEIGAKLYPTNVGDNMLNNQYVLAFESFNVKKDVPAFMLKPNNTTLSVYGGTDALNSLTLNTEYYFRYEATFLLSDDIVSE